MTPIFENDRVSFIAALMRGDLDAAQILLAGAQARLPGLAPLCEADQKAINQMLAAVNKINPPPRKTGGQALWQTRSKVKTALAQVVRAQVRNVAYVGYAD